MILILLLALISQSMINLLNLYSSKLKTGLVGVLKFAVITMPIQLTGYFLLVSTLVFGSQMCSNQYWVPSLILIFAGYVTNLLAAKIILKQQPTKGQAIGLIFVIAGAIIGTLC